MEKKKILLNYIISYLIWSIVVSIIPGSVFRGIIEMLSETVLKQDFNYILIIVFIVLLSVISNSILTLILNAIAQRSAFHNVKTISEKAANNLIISILQFYIFANLILTIISYFINNAFPIIGLVIVIIQLLVGALLINKVLKNYMKKFIVN